jgi:hypothetical protein
MLNGKGNQKQDCADEESRVEAQPEAFLHEAEVCELDLPGADRGVRREKRVQDIARGDAAADGEHWCPGEPIAPDRERRDELGVTHPSRSAVDRCATGLVGEEAGDLRIGEGLEKAEDDRQGPHQRRGRAHRRGNAADGEEDERRDAACDQNASFQLMTL